MQRNIQWSHGRAAASRHAPTRQDLYEAEEQRAIAEFIQETIDPASGIMPLRVVDLGCGARLPPAVWSALLAPHDPDDLDYQGFDISPAPAGAQLAGNAPGGTTWRRHAGAPLKVLPRLETDGFQLVLSLDGVMSHIPPGSGRQALAEIARIADGNVVVGFLGRNADRRGTARPRDLQFPCPAHPDPPLTVTTYGATEIEAALHDVGLDLVALQGFGIEGAEPTVRRSLLRRQHTLHLRKMAGDDTRDDEARLRREVRALVQRDRPLGMRSPDRAHLIVAIAKYT